MSAFFLELFSEEIPARMQARAAADLVRLTEEALAPLSPRDIESYYGPRRLALFAELAPQVAASTTMERGPRIRAPEQALAGFLRKHAASREQLRQEGDFWVLEKSSTAVSAASLIALAVPALLRRFPWPKSMRWGGSSSFLWVRPLRRITCLLDREVVPFSLRDGNDDGHGLEAANLTEGHRFHAPGAFAVTGLDDWKSQLAAHHVLVDAEDRRRMIRDGVAALAEAQGCTVVDDPGLLDEVAGLVEHPVPLLGRIAAEHMDLPPEVMQVSMRVNQRYFALRAADGAAAPWFAFVSNIAAADGGATIVAGNERVLRARFSDARHFWDLDRKARLESRVPPLHHVTFHAKLGSQGARVARLRLLASTIAPLVGADPAVAERGAELAKADLVSGMVGEFPELQGVMGRYYALHDGEDSRVADAIRDHYAPRGAGDAVPTAPVTIAVALADKLDQLVSFFAIDEKPTGSGDPFALRRAALGAIRIIRENRLRLNLRDLLNFALVGHRANIDARRSGSVDDSALIQELLNFLSERLLIQLRAEGARHDVVRAVFSSHSMRAGLDDDIVDLLARGEAVTTLLQTADGPNLLAAYRRAANILRIEERKDGPHDAAPDRAFLQEAEEVALANGLDEAEHTIAPALEHEQYAVAMAAMAALRGPLDAFFERVTVNAPEPELRRNRLRLLHRVRSTMNRVADFSRIEG